MNIKNPYDVLIIGGGISACVFASKYIRSNINGKIAIIEAGRGLGGRSSTRVSKKFKGWEFNHGSPNLNICNIRNSEVLQNFIDELLKNKFIKNDDSDFYQIIKENKVVPLKNLNFSSGHNYISSSSMSELSNNIVAFNNLGNKVDFYFETLVTDLYFEHDHWFLISKNGEFFKSKYLVCSSNLLLHKRSMQILNKKQIPLRKAIPKYKDKNIDTLLDLVQKQKYIPRLTFLIYTKNNYQYKDFYAKKNRYFILKKDLEDKYKLERVIFQFNKENKLGIVLHSKSLDLIGDYLKTKNEDKFKRKIIFIFNKLFEDSPFANKLSGDQDISIMHWRASQPSELAIPLNLQFCSNFNIGFCGDWFDEEGFGRIEGAILSGLRLSKKFNSLN